MLVYERIAPSMSKTPGAEALSFNERGNSAADG